jgi:Ca2+-transporting ATPase
MVSGLSREEADRRLEEHGRNRLEEENPTTKWTIFRRQFKSSLIWILVAAAIISVFAGKTLEFYFINAIIGLIATMGFVQEWKAEQAMQELEEMTQPEVKILRDGKVEKIDREKVVPGDILKLDVGDKIAADAELIESSSLEVDEAILTGESEPVSKDEGDEVFSGTTVTYGRAEARVTKTGMDTELGKIADEIQQDEQKTPLQEDVDRLGKQLGVIAIFATFVILGLGLTKGAPFTEILIVSLALAVASIPEGLPLALTLTLSLGMKDMAKRNAVVKKMLAVESLGSTTTICTDKTGTLTKNEMTVKRIYADGEFYDVEGTGYVPRGDLVQGGESVNIQDTDALRRLYITAVLCNNSYLMVEDGNYTIRGEPTEAALTVMGEKEGLKREELEEEFRREEELMFTSDRKCMTTVNEETVSGEHYAFTKGAPEVVLEKCSHVMVEGEKKELTDQRKEQILERNTDMAGDALRVLGFAFREDIEPPFTEENTERDMTFVGLAGMIDPPREEIQEALENCRDAGIDVKMVTGDNARTARAIGRDIGLAEEPVVLTGEELQDMSDEELSRKIPEIDIFARTHPEDKLRIVELLQDHDEIVAMTGDGVNDAPAVKKADIGISMGQKGTDVTNEASDVILEDDNFATIVSAIRDGRRIFDNIEKFTTYLVSINFTEIVVLALGIAIFGFEYLPLIAVQILFLNVVEEEIPAISLGMDPGSDGLMDRPPRNPSTGIMHRRNLFLVGSMASVMGLSAFAVFYLSDPLQNLEISRTATFVAISLMMGSANVYRSLDRSILETGVFRNRWLIGSLLLLAPIVFALVYFQPVAEIFGHQPLPLETWKQLIVAGLIPVISLELLKQAANRWIDQSYMYK